MWLLFLNVMIFYLNVVYILTSFFLIISIKLYIVCWLLNSFLLFIPFPLSLFHKLVFFILSTFIFNIINISFHSGIEFNL